MKILNREYVKKHTPKVPLKVKLVKNQKGTSLVATQDFKKNQLIAYYKFRVFRDKNFVSKTKNMYTFRVVTKNDKTSRTLIGDLVEESLAPPKRGIPFWAYFANEPSGKQTSNCWIDSNIAENYKNRDKVVPGDYLVYKLRASEFIPAGSEIVWCYGNEYLRDYEPNC
jgi:hypothetical protein